MVLNRHTLGSLFAAMASVPAWPAALLVGIGVFRSERPGSLGRIVILLACAAATLAALGFGSLVFITPRR
jgi:hypothetical protein